MRTKDLNVIVLQIAQIGWPQDSIQGTFFDMREAPHVQNEAFIAKFPLIRVVGFQEQGWITLDKDRLFIFMRLLNPGPKIFRVATSEEVKELKHMLTNEAGGLIPSLEMAHGM